MGKSLKIILEEEVEKTVDSIPKNQLVPILKTLLTEKDDIIIRSLRGYVDDFNSNNQIPAENWNWLRDTLKVLANSNQRFQFKCKEVNNKLYCVKHYTNLPFEISEAVEDELKYELKKYFKEIVYEEVDQFIF
jgi:hypothetical protein